MSFDFSTLVTNRTQADVAYVKQLVNKLVSGTATADEVAEWNSFMLKGAYNYTDLNRVTAAMDALKTRLESHGYAVQGYKKIEIKGESKSKDSNVPISRLPAGYRELTYIESSGLQYIDTGYYPNAASRAVIDVQFTQMPSSNSALLGTIEGTTYWYIYYRQSNAQYRGRYGTQGEKAIAYADPTIRATVENGPAGFKCGDEVLTWNTHEFQLSYPAYLFARNNDGTVAASAYSCRMFSCKIYEGETLVRDFVPCANSSNVAGMYDLVNGVFYVSIGTSDFIHGETVRAFPKGYKILEYIETSGTQYIDTGFVGNQETRIVLDHKFTAGTSLTGFCSRVSHVDAGIQYSAEFNGSASQSYVQHGATFQYTANLDGFNRHVVDYDKNNFYHDGELIYTFSPTTFTTPTAIMLAAFCNNSGQDIIPASGIVIYSCQIYDNGKLVRDFVPCANNVGVVGLYDVENGVFYTNSGTGEFIVPEEPDGQSVKVTNIIPDFGSLSLGNIFFSGGVATFAANTVAMANATTKTNTPIGEHKYYFRMSYCSPVGLSATVINIQLRKDDYANGFITFYSGTTYPIQDGLWHNYSSVVSAPATPTAGDWFYRDYTYIASKFSLQKELIAIDLTESFGAGNEPTAEWCDKNIPFFVGEKYVETPPTYEWGEHNAPTSENMTLYLLNLSALRSVLSAMITTPNVPKDMVNLMIQEANDIEKILLDTNTLINRLEQTWCYSNEVFSEEV